MTSLPPLFTLSILHLSLQTTNYLDSIDDYIESITCLTDYTQMFDLLGCKLTLDQLICLEDRVQLMLDLVQYKVNTLGLVIDNNEFQDLCSKETKLGKLICEVTEQRNFIENLQTKRFEYATN